MPTLKMIGRYQIKTEIARGGMATVYHAYDPRFERDVAIKVLPRALLHDPQFRVRFEREAKTIALLEHPAIVPVYDFGEEGEQPYIVMRLMAGGSLTDRLHKGPLGLQETAQIITRLASALDAAHARNIVHRDLKPGNILFDQYDNAYLSDFGIARMSTGAATTLTGESILGTPGYMSPEQVQGDKSIDGRSDVYSLGVLVYQMLVGHIPYQADTPAKVMMMHLLQPVPDILRERPDLPVGAQSLIARAMAKRPEDRFPTAGQLAQALEALVHQPPGEPVLIAPGKPVVSSAVVQPIQALPVAEETRAAPEKTAVSTPTEVTPAEEGPQEAVADAIVVGPAAPVQGAEWRKSSSWMIIGGTIAALVLLGIVIGAFALGRPREREAALLAPASPTMTFAPATNTPAPTPTATGEKAAVLAQTTPAAERQAIPTATELPSITPTIEPTPTSSPTPGPPIIGGADKIAYLNGNEIWVANLDGSAAEQLTSDGSIKSNLQWAPDGRAVNFISGKCVNRVRLADKQIDVIACFNFLQYLKAFEVSPNGQQVAASMDNQLYILPYDLDALRSVSVRGDLARIAPCKDFAPYERYVVKFPRWSRDGARLAMIRWGLTRDVGAVDTITIEVFDKCTPYPDVLDNFPAKRFKPEGFENNPTLFNFGWDGLDLFAFTTQVRSNGFGKLYIYNGDLKKGEGPVIAIGECCYRDPVFSPDGSHILFAYQDYTGSDKSIHLYLIPFGSLGTGANYQPLSLPALDPSSQPQAALRPVR